MELSNLLRIIRRNWLVLAIFSILGLAGGALASALTPVQYSSSTTLYVSVQISSASTTSELVQGNNFAIQKVFSYVDVATSARVLDPVIADLGLDTTATSLADDVTAAVQPNSVVIELTAKADSSANATELASAVADSFSDLVVNELEAPADGSPSPVKVEIIQPATQPSSPALPQVPLNLALGLLLGLAIGIVLALVLGLTDRRIRNVADVRRVVDLPVLGQLTADRRARTKPLISGDGVRSTRSEGFRTLRTNLDYAGIGGSTRSIVVTSSLPGEGKTTTAINLAIALAESGSSVVLIDSDLRVPRVARYLGIDGDVGLTDVLSGKVGLVQACQRWGARGEIVVLPAGLVPPNPTALVGSKQMGEMLVTLSSEFDHVIIDAPPILAVTDAVVVSRWATATLLVLDTSQVKEKHVLSALEALEVAGGSPVGIVLTKLPTRGPDSPLNGGTVGYGLTGDPVQLSDEESTVLPTTRGRARTVAPESGGEQSSLSRRS